MKYLKYQIVNRSDVGTEENLVWHESFYEKKMPYSEANEEIAKQEAYNGEYEIEDDGVEEAKSQPTTDERVEALEAAVTMLCMPDVNEV